MTLEQFERHAVATWAQIPAALKVDVVGVVVDPEPRYDPEFPDVALMGECRLDPAVELVAEAPVRSIIHLYHGSFVEIAARHEADTGQPFDWAGELEETLHHELQHHLDWRQGHDALGDEDDRQRENMLRLRGEPFDRSVYRYCEPVADGVTRLDKEVFFEVPLSRRHYPRMLRHGLVVDWRGLRLTTAPAAATEAGRSIVYLEVEAIDEPTVTDDPALEAVLSQDWELATVVVRRRRRWRFERTPPWLSIEVRQG